MKVGLRLTAVITLLLLTLIGVGLGKEAKVTEVTCGSGFKLLNTAYKIRLHSHDIKYGSGSGQQSVTGSELKEDVNSIWVLKGTPNLPCKRG
jgi:dolichyl-phosphate-mannose--protein O-mannosyl transferase